VSVLVLLPTVGLGLGLAQAWWAHGRPTRARGKRAEPPRTHLVRELRRLTGQTVAIELDGAFGFIPGQFVMVRQTPQAPWRSYSLTRAPGEPLRLVVKRVPQGLVSSALTERLTAGSVLEVKGPYGRFTPPDDARALVLVAGGSGLTPMLAILHQEAARGWPRPVRLIDAQRSVEDAFLGDELGALARSSRGQLQLVQLIGAVFDARSLGAVDEGAAVMSCGPEGLMHAVRDALPGVSILEERFTARADIDDTIEYLALAIEAGRATRLSVRGGETVLAAAQRQGLRLPSGCEQGACGQCRVKMLSGDLEVSAASCLSPEERAQGLRLTCVGTLRGDASFEVPLAGALDLTGVPAPPLVRQGRQNGRG